MNTVEKIMAMHVSKILLENKIIHNNKKLKIIADDKIKNLALELCTTLSDQLEEVMCTIFR